jgi:hypothetical protein
MLIFFKVSPTILDNKKFHRQLWCYVALSRGPEIAKSQNKFHFQKSNISKGQRFATNI